MTTGSKSTPAARKAAAKAKTPKTTQKKTTTTKLVWRDVTCRVKHTPNYLSKGWSHIEIIVVSPKKAPLPITETGYRSHFLDENLLKKAGGPATFFLDWIEREAATKAWAKAEFKWRQGDLFQTVSQRRR
jgi:hypothetical protein